MRLTAAILLCLLTGCTTSWRHLQTRAHEATQVYTTGSGFSGDGESLLLFSDQRWERWRYSDLDARRIGQGSFHISDTQLALSSPGHSDEVFTIGIQRSSIYLRDQRLPARRLELDSPLMEHRAIIPAHATD